MNGWVVTRYADVLATCSSPETFGSDYFFDGPAGLYDATIAEHRRYAEVSSQNFMVTDPPRHTKLRSLFRNSFTPRSIRSWRAYVEAITDRLLDAHAPGDHVDLMSELAATVPGAVISRILGIPDDDLPQFRAWTDAYVDTFSGFASVLNLFPTRSKSRCAATPRFILINEKLYATQSSVASRSVVDNPYFN